MAVLLQDLRYGARLLLRSPAMTAVVALSLALGIGANTTIFTLVNAVLLNPLPVRDASRLARIVTTEVRDGVVTPLGAISRLNALDVRDKNVVFDGVAAAGFTAVALSSGGEPEQVFAQIASGNFFDVLGPPMAAGRTPDGEAIDLISVFEGVGAYQAGKIDDRRLNFQFGTQIGWRIRHGRLAEMIRNPTYTGITPQFWGSCDAIVNRDGWVVWGTPNCGKGQPEQVAHTGHGASASRFRNIQVVVMQ